jgi:hypothetical protein
MKRLIATLAASLAVAAAGAGTAFASDPVQVATQSAATDQAAGALSSATQDDPSNQNISVRVLSPGSDGAVTQTNTAASSANATNTASTTQNAAQTETPGCGCVGSPAQPMAHAAQTGDVDGVLSGATQLAADDPAAPATTSSAGSDVQADTAGSSGAATNTAPTTQAASQTQPAGGVQSSDQSATTDQQAVAASSAKQDKPSNSNISVRVLSPGDNGSVTQSNTAASSATASNSATPSQSSQQAQGGSGSGVQSSTQSADTDQKAVALSEAKQIQPSNSNFSVRVGSPGNDGSVSQSNTAASSASSTNTAPVTQTAKQTQSGSPCGCDGKGGVQSLVQSSDVDQAGIAASKAEQVGASNVDDPVRIGSKGDGGSVTQSNTAGSSATTSNSATPTQTGQQTQSGSGSGVQSSFQSADTDQKGVALSEAKQIQPSNSNSSVRVGSPGNDGPVTQSNKAASSAQSTNTAPVTQTATQDGFGSRCGCTDKGSAVQALFQSSKVDQLGVAASKAEQIGASNADDPVRIGSTGDGGSVTQSNTAASSATTTNRAAVTQSGSQQQADPKCGCSSGPAVQALGQSSWTGQFGVALSAAKQIGAENDAEPVRIWSPGSDGTVTQSNTAASSGSASNTATPDQRATQQQSGSGIQALGQEAKNAQGAIAASLALQLPGRSPCGCGESFGNSADPVRIGSPGGDGSLSQANTGASSATAANTATPTQSGQQNESFPCGCAGLGIQALGQQALTKQFGKALSAALQVAPTNDSEPVRLWSWGGDGSAGQRNSSSSSGSAPNSARVPQTGAQMMV